MKHSTTRGFWKHYRRLPSPVQQLADKNHALLEADPDHPSLQFKKIKPALWSVRIGLAYRALATEEGGDYVWFWIGPHDEYDRLIR